MFFWDELDEHVFTGNLRLEVQSFDPIEWFLGIYWNDKMQLYDAIYIYIFICTLRIKNLRICRFWWKTSSFLALVAKTPASHWKPRLFAKSMVFWCFTAFLTFLTTNSYLELRWILSHKLHVTPWSIFGAPPTARNVSKEKQRWEHEVRCLKHRMFHCYITQSASCISHMFVLYGTDFSTQVLLNE